MPKLSALEREQLEVAQFHLMRFLRTYKKKFRKGKAVLRLQRLEALMNNIDGMVIDG